jgi:hypothetical protein
MTAAGPERSGGGRAATARDAARRVAAATGGLVREHWLFSALMAAGLVLRVITQLAYQPALIFLDSIPYLHNSQTLTPEPVRPLGYPILLRILSYLGPLDVVPLVQHLGGLVAAVVLYATLLRLRVVRWAAALATAPLLLDALQLNLEQQVLSDTAFEFFLAGTCCLLVWRARPSVTMAAAAGGLLGAASVTRPVALIAIGPAVLTLLFLRAGLARVAALGVAFAVPVLLYAAWFHHSFGVYSMTGYDGHFLYARVAPFAHCRDLSLTASQRELCPTQPVGRRLTVDQYMWSNASPINRLRVSADDRHGRPLWLARSEIAAGFAHRVILHQPFTYARVVVEGFLRGFAPTRSTQPGEVLASRWKFQLQHPWRISALRVLSARGDPPHMNAGLARFLHGYQRFGYTPGPILGLAMLAGLLAALGIGRARRSGLRSACFLFSVTAAALLLSSVAVSQFSWRYQIPQLVLLPPAAALAWTAFRGRRAAVPAAAPTPVPEASPVEPSPR